MSSTRTAVSCALLVVTALVSLMGYWIPAAVIAGLLIGWVACDLLVTVAERRGS